MNAFVIFALAFLTILPEMNDDQQLAARLAESNSRMISLKLPEVTLFSPDPMLSWIERSVKQEFLSNKEIVEAIRTNCLELHWLLNHIEFLQSHQNSAFTILCQFPSYEGLVKKEVDRDFLLWVSRLFCRGSSVHFERLRSENGRYQTTVIRFDIESRTYSRRVYLLEESTLLWVEEKDTNSNDRSQNKR